MSLFQNISLQNVPFDGLVAQPMQVGPQNYQYMLQQNVQCHPQIKGALADIAAYIHNTIAQKATTNLARAVHFNMIMMQNNPEMFILTSLVANMVYFRLTNGQYNDFNTAVTQVTDWAVTRRVNFITVNVPELINSMQSQAGHIQQFANEYVAEAQSTMQQISETYMGGTSGFGNGNQQQRANGMGGGFGGQPASGFGNNNNGGGMSMGFGGSGAATGFGMGNNNNGRRGGNVIVRSSDANAPAGDRFSDDLMGGLPAFQPPALKKEEEVKQEVKEAPKAEQRPSNLMQQMENGLAGVVKSDAPAGELPLVDDKGNLIIPNLPTTKAKWQASRHQLQPLLWDKRRYDINRRGFTLEGTNYVIDTLKKVPMDRAAHSLPPTVDFLNKVAPAEKTREEFREKTLIEGAALLNVVRDINVEAEYVERVNELRDYGHMVFGGGLSSIEEAVSMSRQAAMLCSKSEIGAYTTEFMIAKEFTVFKDDAAALRDLGKCRTIGALVDEIRAIIQDPHANHALRVAVVQLNAYLAESWMEWIRFYLCLDEFDGSDSFIDDVQAMRDDIGTIAGIPYRRLIDANQQRFIQTYLAFGAERESDLEDTLKDAGAEDKGRNVVVVPILTPSMMVCTEFLDSEYAFASSAEIDGRDIACCFSEESTSAGFRKMVQTMIERPRSIGLQAQIRRFYITTLDNVVYEVNMGLDEKAPPMLIKKVKRV